MSEYANGLLSKRADTEIFSKMDFPLSDVMGGKYGGTPESVEQFNCKFLDTVGYLFVIPEYNGGFQGVLRVFFDYLSFPDVTEKKPVRLIGEAAGAFGVLRPVEQFQQLLIYRKSYFYPERMLIQRVNESFDSDEGLGNE